MDFLNRALGQLGDLFRSMTPGARLTAALLVVVIGVSVSFLVRHNSGGADDYLFWGQELAPGELNALEASFNKANLTGWQIEGNRIRVPLGQRGAFMGAAADGSALPANFGDRFRKAVEANIFLSKQEREQRLRIALQEELSLSIRGMKGVEKASVIYDIKERPGLNRELLATASVSVKPLGTLSLEPDRVEDIRNLVASAIAGMKPENVSVTDQNGRTYPAMAGKSSAGEFEYRRAMLAYETDFRRKIEQALAYVPGAMVSVNVEPDAKLGEKARTVSFDKSKSAPQVIDSETSDENKQSAQPGGAPGTRTNSSANEGAELARAEKNTSTRNQQKERQVNIPGGSETIIETAGLVPKRVTVSVSIPKTYFESIWKARNNIAADGKLDATAVAALEQDKLTELRQHVAQVLPPEILTDPMRQVKITTFDVLPQPEIPGPTTAETALGWLGQYWGSLGMFGLGLFGLVMLRSIVKGAAPVATPGDSQIDLSSAASTSSAHGGGHAATHDAAHGSSGGGGGAMDEKTRTLQWKRRDGMSLRDELVELVREDPNTAAAILRGWIGSAV